MKKFTIDANPSLLRRIMAIVYDAFLVAAILLASMAIMVLLRVTFGQPLQVDEIAISGIWRVPALLFCLLNVSFFFCYFWVKNAKTLGMQAWRLAILTPENKQISWKQAYSRIFLALLSLSFVGLGYLVALIDPEKQTLHDKLSGTKTVLLKK